MKKIMSFLLIVMLTACGNNERTYDIGKDTVCAFGDGTYQIMHGYRDDEAVETLYNCKHDRCVIDKIDAYMQQNHYVYLIGEIETTIVYYGDLNTEKEYGNSNTEKVYAKLNTENNLLLYYTENLGDFNLRWFERVIEDQQIKLLSVYDEYSEDDQKIFENMMD